MSPSNRVYDPPGFIPSKSWNNLPLELVLQIAANAPPELLPSMALMCKAANQIATPLLYHTVVIKTYDGARAFGALAEDSSSKLSLIHNLYFSDDADYEISKVHLHRLWQYCSSLSNARLPWDTFQSLVECNIPTVTTLHIMDSLPGASFGFRYQQITHLALGAPYTGPEPSIAGIFPALTRFALLFDLSNPFRRILDDGSDSPLVGWGESQIFNWPDLFAIPSMQRVTLWLPAGLQEAILRHRLLANNVLESHHNDRVFAREFVPEGDSAIVDLGVWEADARGRDDMWSGGEPLDRIFARG